EILATSDVPAGVVNILTGHRAPLVRALAAHGNVDCVDLTGCDPASADGADLGAEAERLAAATVTRVVHATAGERHWLEASAQSPYAISAFCEYKTVWHPKGR
ncbi:MAG: aldehyde dehydrogenase family protein, partial [bacterium]|nr:aldehyde dehydrogenase family protein [bacterium]